MLLVLISLKIGDEQLRNNNVISANKIVFADVLMLLKKIANSGCSASTSPESRG